MTTIRHTPGPWHVQQVGTPGYFVINQASGIPVPAAGPKGEANARLMAASPKLAAALLRCYTFLNDNFEDYDMPDILGPAREALGEAGLLVDASHAPARAREAALSHRDCGHSACGQHYIDTGETRCIEGEE